MITSHSLVLGEIGGRVTWMPDWHAAPWFLLIFRHLIQRVKDNILLFKVKKNLFRLHFFFTFTLLRSAVQHLPVVCADVESREASGYLELVNKSKEFLHL
uniref:Uncharacterized protein n=1 Tax=Pyxicephalus adspersus TaxID=30357 RepID=A0AAV2ZHL1_PYXAD|nr:TPA: hypothetical protein GDO54_004477 [Pyxicephalus adspersus]